MAAGADDGTGETAFLAGGGEMGARMRAFDWSQTPVGPPATWPRSLRTTVRLALDSRYPMFVWWGRELTKFYNDAYAPVLGGRHPAALGRPAAAVWADIWDVVGPQAAAVLRDGAATWNEEVLLVMERNGYPEETYFTFSYSPAPDDAGGVGGVFCACTEETARVVGRRRLATLRALAEHAGGAKDPAEACAVAAATLAQNRSDVPFALLYLLGDDGRTARLAGAAGLEPGTAASPQVVDAGAAAAAAAGDDGARGWPLAEAMASGAAVSVDDVEARFGPLPGGVWPESPRRAVVLPLAKAGQARAAGFVVAGISPRRPCDDDYRGFLDLLAGHVATAVANARAHADERRRAAALAELDRAKTAFFSNLSHEFRTPLTLMLAPAADLLADPAVPPAARDQVGLVHRNGLRLLKLVNALLDFTRIEAGRAAAAFEPVDLSAATAELAGAFRSAVERAGLRLTVDCPPLGEPVYVDPDMWEKVVLNLVSNALKFTPAGEVAVAVRRAGGRARVEVRDTGVGIPADELPRVFDRFHRVPGARGRTHEGTGIGLALVQELVRLHGGTIDVASEVGRGTTFAVELPLGAAHLPADQVAAPAPTPGAGPFAPDPAAAAAYVLEAIGPEDAGSPSPTAAAAARDTAAAEAAPVAGPAAVAPPGADPPPAAWSLPPAVLPQPSPPPDRPRALLAEDNADMRAYVRRLLGDAYDVEAVADGTAALAAARARRPDVVLSDVMMPTLDGFALLRALRADPALADVPVVLLSARAGEEATVEGVRAGADDYLVKPFAARELLARVAGQVERAALRRALRASERRFVEFADAAPALLWITDAGGRCTYLSRGWYEYTGQTPATGLGMGWVDAVHPDDRAATRAAFLNATAAGESFAQDYRLRRADGTYRWAIDMGRPRFAPGGEFLGFVGSVVDIHDRKLAEAELRDARHRLEGILAANDVATWTLDVAADRLTADANLVRLFGISEAEAADGRLEPYLARIAADDRSAVSAAIERSVATGEPYACEYRVVRPDGSTIWVSARGRVRPGPDGRPGSLDGVVIDVTDRRRAEEAVRASEVRLRLVADNLPVLLSYVDADERYQFHNRAYEAWFGRAGREMDGRALPDVLGDAAYERVQPYVRRALAGERVTYEARLPYKDGGPRDVEVTYVPDVASDGRVRGCYAMVADVTARKRAEDAVRAGAERLRLAQLAGRVGGFEWLIPEDRIAWSPELEALYGMPPGSFEGTLADWRKRVVPEDAARVEAGIARCLDEGRTEYAYEFRAVLPDGTQRWLYGQAAFAYDVAGRATRMTGVNVDVDARKRAEEALAASERRLQLAVAIGRIGTFDIDLATDAVTVNDPGRAIYGWPAGQPLTFAGVQRHFHPDDRDRVAAAVGSALDPSGPGEFDVEQRIVRTDGATRWIRVRGRAIFEPAGPGGTGGAGPSAAGAIAARDDGSAGGGPQAEAPHRRAVRLVGTYIDVTDRVLADRQREAVLEAERRARAEAEAYAREAERVNRMKDEFLATLSHELRTPLNAILGWAHLLAQGGAAAGPGADPDARQGLEAIERNARAQAQMIEDLLDMSRIVSGQVRLDVQRVDPAAVIGEAIESVAPSADARGVRLVRVLDPNAGPVSGDPGRLRQVVWNLLSNAIKFTPRGGRVQVVLGRVDSHVEVSVDDTGEGIDPEFLPYVFDRFRQQDASTTRRHGGLGLGLNIVKQIVELHGGTVRARSAGRGQGATFVVTLPLAPATAAAAPPPLGDGGEAGRPPRGDAGASGRAADVDGGAGESSLAGARVLVVDDDRDARALIARILTRRGAAVTAVGSVPEALAALGNGGAGAATAAAVVDVIVSDIGMPGEDGYDLIRAVRARPAAAGGATPAVALTAFARSDDRRRALRAGYQTHVAKPVEPAELVETVASLARWRRDAAAR